MEKREQYKRLIMFCASAVIILLQTGIFAYVWFRYYDSKEVLQMTFWNKGNYVVIGIYGLMIFLFYKLYGGFKVGYLRVIEVLVTQIFAVLCVNCVTYLQLCLIGRWKFLDHVMPMLFVTAVDLVIVVIWVVFMRWFYAKLYPPRQMLFIYGEYSPDRLIHKIRTRPDKYNIEETISVDEDMEVIKAKILNYHSIILGDIPVRTRNRLLKFCFQNDIRCYSVPKISDIMIDNSTQIQLFDTTLMLFRNRGLTIEQQFFKRLVDIVVSLAGLVVASPILLLIALCIKLYDGGPVLFTQDRLTKGGKVFKLYKFRSMRVQKEDDDYCMTRKNDDRITPVGKIIRSIHFDELPQLYNILKGDMSLVGPRPECPELAKKYCEIIPEFNMRLKVKAGLTGYAQVYGKYNTTPYDKLKLDLTYIEKYSLMLDFQLILLTVKVLFMKENTEGIEKWQKSAATEENLQKIGEKEADEVSV